MRDATFLQIQGRGDSTMRMLELPAGPVRIGRGAHCEVQLGGPELGDVQCMLRRRGNTWHFQPVGPPGQAWIDGRPADQQRPVALGVPFRVGEHWLTLRPADSATNDWGSFEAPIAIEPEVRPAEPPPPEGSPSVKDRPRAASAPVDDEERLRRWEARLEQRERWLKDRQEERRWEARWKSAGESIRGRAAHPSATPVAPPVQSPPSPTISAPKTPLRAPQTPPVARILEPGNLQPIRRVADRTPRPSTARVAVRPLAQPAVPIRRPLEPINVRIAIQPARIASKAAPVEDREPTEAPATRSMIALTPSPAEVVEPPEIPIVPEVAGPIVPSSEAEGTSSPSATPAGATPIPPEPVLAFESQRPSSGEIEPETGGDEGVPIEVVIDEVEPIEPPALPAVIESPPRIDSWLEDAAETSRPVEAAALPVERAVPEFEAPRPRWQDPQPLESSGVVGVSRAEWPSARAIFEAQGRRAQPAPQVTKGRRRRSPEPEPTDVLGPAHWTVPLWLGWFPVVLLSGILGAGGLVLSSDWAVEASNADTAIRMALREAGTPGPAVDPAAIPRGGWWSSSATHLAAWAMALQRANDGEDHSDDVRSLLNSARSASQLSARSRFIVEWPESSEPGATPEFLHLGRTRDVVTLAWTGRRLRKAGKLDSAIRAYRAAMEIASKTSLEDLDPPIFYEDSQVRRYALPREALLGLVVGHMSEDGDWTREQWSEALPPSAVSSLVASRVLNQGRKRADADRLADLAIKQAESPPPPGFDPAEERAAGAEALAYRGRWTDAAEQYRLAIDRVDVDPIRRMWWLNLAEVAQRIGDDPARDRAIEAAKAPDSADEITGRALKYQQSLPGSVSTSPQR